MASLKPRLDMTVETTVRLTNRAGVVHRDRQDRQQLVAVDHRPVSRDRQATVGVAIVRDADVGAALDHRGDELVEVRRTAAVVDVQPVGLAPDGADGRTRQPQRLGRGAIGSAVRAVDDDLQPGRACSAR